MTRKLRAKTFQKNLYFILYHLKSHTRPKNTYIKLSPPSHLGFQTRMSCPNAFCPAEKGPFPKSPLAALRSSTHPQRRPSQPPRMHAPPLQPSASRTNTKTRDSTPSVKMGMLAIKCWPHTASLALYNLARHVAAKPHLKYPSAQVHSRFTISHVISQPSAL